MKTPLRRHDLAYVSDAAAVCPALPPCIQDWLADWISAGKPLVVARQRSFPKATAPHIDLGAALPLRLERGKVACGVSHANLLRTTSALSVEAVSSVLPGHDRHVLARLSELAERWGIALGVYGSTAWECLSGEPYRRADSDVDLISDVRQHDTLSPWLRAMTAAAQDMDGRLDGEIRFPSGEAVAWRELARAGITNAGAQVLVKTLHNVGFVPVGALMGSLQ